MREDLKVVTYEQEITEIGVIADTHIPTRGRNIPSRVFELFDEVQLILHAGDLVDEKILVELQALAPVEAVAGNMDSGDLGSRLGRIKLVQLKDLSIGLLHGDLSGRRIDPGEVLSLFEPYQPQAVVFGHLHEPVCQMHGETLFFNPGSVIDPRRQQPSCGCLKIIDGEVKGEIVYLD
ncbi:MAG: YfcE family phosphodiesterase [Bacillota bacterium]